MLLLYFFTPCPQRSISSYRLLGSLKSETDRHHKHSHFNQNKSIILSVDLKVNRFPHLPYRQESINGASALSVNSMNPSRNCLFFSQTLLMGPWAAVTSLSWPCDLNGQQPHCFLRLLGRRHRSLANQMLVCSSPLSRAELWVSRLALMSMASLTIRLRSARLSLRSISSRPATFFRHRTFWKLFLKLSDRKAYRMGLAQLLA